jgi:diguanylate cyclase (GGDEF)-like protein
MCEADREEAHRLRRKYERERRARLEAEAIAERATRDALHDPLTGVANRALFLDRLAITLARVGRLRSAAGVLYLDLDNFKQVNDGLGHAAGDELLIAAAERIRACLRPGDSTARLGGDEFAVLLEDLAGVDDAKRVADRILAALRQPFTAQGREVFISVSVGVAVTYADETDPDQLLRNADIAMYSAKEGGKGRHVVFDRSMHDALLDRTALERDLWRAVERGEMRLVYQPLVDLHSGCIVGAEALVRWDHPVRGTIGPDRFIPIAVKAGLIADIDAWVVDTACAQARAWRDAGLPPVRIAVNASGGQFEDGSVVERVSESLRRHGVPPGQVEVELSERVAVRHENTTETVHRLQAMGVRVAIDDFGTGYSMLDTLRHFPGDTLKIDKGFVDELVTGGDRAPLLGAIIAMGHGLGLRVVAEGVETTDQLAFLRLHGCDEAQGYIFSRPVDPTAFERKFRDSMALAAFGLLMRTSAEQLDAISEVVSAEPDLEPLVRRLLADLQELSGLDCTYLLRRLEGGSGKAVWYVHNGNGVVVPEGLVLGYSPTDDSDCRPLSDALSLLTELSVPVFGSDGGLIGWIGGASAAETKIPSMVRAAMELFAHVLGTQLAHERAVAA